MSKAKPRVAAEKPHALVSQVGTLSELDAPLEAALDLAELFLSSRSQGHDLLINIKSEDGCDRFHAHLSSTSRATA